MRRPAIYLLPVILLLALFYGSVLRADEGESVPTPTGNGPDSAASVLANLGTAFTYQGRLVDAGAPAAGVYDFRFRLYDAAAGGVQIGATQSVNDVAVAGGLFTTTLDFGAGAFNGLARWLEIDVKRDTDAGYTTLSPRVALSPAPLALALPGFYTQQTTSIPNLIGGYSYNSVTGSVYGATISGGGRSGGVNSVTDDFGTVGGGSGNQAGDNVDTHYSSIHATVSGGGRNEASGDGSTIGGGTDNEISSFDATIGGGLDNTASGNRATIGGGLYNTASDRVATIGGGGYNKAAGIYATVGGGLTNTASGDYSTIPGGHYGLASHYGELAYASGIFNAVGDAQTSLYVLRRETGDAALTELFLDGASQRITLAADRVMTFDILVVGSHRFGGGSSAGYQVAGVIRNIGGATAFVGTPIKTVLGENVAGWDVQVTADDSLDALVIKAQGSNYTSVRWVASVRTVELGR